MEKVLAASIGLLQTANHGSVYFTLFGKCVCMFLFGQWVRFSRFRIMEKRYVSGSLVSASAIRGGTAIPMVLNIQFWIPDCDMNIIREAGSCWLYLSEYGPCPVPADEDILSASIPVNALRSCHGTKKICYERIMTVCTGMNHGALSGLFSRMPFVPEAVAYQ